MAKRKQPRKCPYCKKFGLVKCGFRDTMYRGRLQKYRCKKCKRTITKGEHHRSRVPDATINQIFILHKQGKSTRQIATKIRSISHVAVADILKKYNR